MLAEMEGQHFYRMAAATTEDEKGRAVFTQLAQEEENHFNVLRTQMAAFKDTGKLDKDAKFERFVSFDGSSPIFTESLKDRIFSAHFEMTALAIGVQLELNAVEHYTEQAENASAVPEVREFFLHLAEWERRHYQALLSQQESLKGDYWSAQGFSPM